MTKSMTRNIGIVRAESLVRNENQLLVNGTLDGKSVVVDISERQEIFVNGKKVPRAIISTQSRPIVGPKIMVNGTQVPNETFSLQGKPGNVIVSIEDFQRLQAFLDKVARAAPLGFGQSIYLHEEGKRNVRGIDLYCGAFGEWAIFRPDGERLNDELYKALFD